MAEVPQSKRRINQLLRQYPFLRDLYRFEANPKLGVPEVNVQISVKRGDPDLMFRQADNVDGVGRSIGRSDYPDLMGTQYEYYHPVNRAGQMGEIRHWKEWRGQYVRDLFNRPCYDWLADDSPETEDDPFQVVDGVVWVTREDWYPEGSDLSRTFHGVQVVRRNIWITLFKEPRQGWRELYQTADPLVNVTLHGWRLIDGPELQDSFREIIYDRLNRLAQEFQRKVWEDGLGKIIDDSRSKGMSGNFGGVEVLSYIIAGRLQIQLERGGAVLTLGGFENVNAPNLGFSSIHGTGKQAEKLVRDVIRFWDQADAETRRTVHQDSSSVGLGF